jgi:hypothetical protein
MKSGTRLRHLAEMRVCLGQTMIGDTRVTIVKLPNALSIAPGYTIEDWTHLSGKLDPAKPDSEDWRNALEIFKARVQRRFLDAADVLIRFDRARSHWTFGFAILAIDFLVIDAMGRIQRLHAKKS